MKKTLLDYLGVRAAMVTAKEEGKAEGIEMGKTVGALSIAKKMKSVGMETQLIAQMTGLSPAQIDQL
jgi:predicted transposase/invertase (TIGR01784 family)